MEYIVTIPHRISCIIDTYASRIDMRFLFDNADGVLPDLAGATT
jgi:hypothetical protein